MKKNRKTIIFLNGQWIEADASLLTGLTPGIVRGQGVFETFLIHHGTVVFWTEHLERFQRGLKAYRIKLPYSIKKLKADVARAIDLNQLTSGRLRLAAFKDEGQLFVCIVAQPVSPSRKTFRVEISPLVRPYHRFSHLKSIEYEPFYSARMHAREAGYDEAILLNPDRHVVEGSISNVFWLRKGQLYTPSTRCGCLNGIVRQWTIRTARRIGIPVQMGPYALRELKRAEAIFLTNSAMGIKPVSEFDGRRYARPASGVTAALQAMWDQGLNH